MSMSWRTSAPTRLTGLASILRSSRLSKILRPAALALVLLLPFTATSVLPLLDYPNHLARMAIETADGRDPALAAMYSLHWAFFPNLAMDLVVPALARVLPLSWAASLFAASAVLLSVSGCIALHRAWFGGRSWWPYASALTGFGFVLTNGFLNYLFGLGVALWSAAIWIRLSGRAFALRAGFAIACGLVCLLCHIFAFALLGLLLASLELVPRRGSVRPRPGGAVLVLAAVALPFLVYKLLGPANTYSSAGQGRLFLQQLLAHGLLAEPRMRLLWLVGTVSSPAAPLSPFSLALLCGVPAAALLRRSLGAARPILAAAVCLLIGYLLLPSTVVDNGMVYPRLALPFVLLVVAGLNPQLGPVGAPTSGAVLALLLLGHAAGTVRIWRHQEPLLRDIRHVIAPIPPCARVLAVRDGGQAWMVDADEPPVDRVFYNGIVYANLPAILTVDRHAFWPMVFAESGKQPLVVRAPFRSMQQDDGYLPLSRQLTLEPSENRRVPGSNRWPAQLSDWRHRYDYVLVLHRRPGTTRPLELRLVRAHGFAALYRVTSAAKQPSCEIAKK